MLLCCELAEDREGEWGGFQGQWGGFGVDGGSCSLTLGHHFAKHWHGLQSGAVPSTVAKLKLTLVYGQLGSATHGVHHLHAALTDLHLKEDQKKQTKKTTDKFRSKKHSKRKANHFFFPRCSL